MFLWRSLISLYIIIYLYQTNCVHAKDGNEDLYSILGVAKDASLKVIRKAFKSLAVLKHPDKIPDDPNATANFMKLTRAYDVLKDPETRKTYDLYGEDSLGGKPNTKFQSYSYYKNEFGIYDDDPLIVTLSKADYELNILDENQAWWVNFYSPACHHCHTLAPTWRKLAQELEGVVRIAAVNCEDDWVLCHQLSINAYPTLLYYEKEAHLHEGEKYTGVKNFDDLQDFILSKISVNINRITSENWKELQDKSNTWLLFLCAKECPDPQTQIKLAAVFDGLMEIGIIEDANLCDEFSTTNSVVLYQNIKSQISISGLEGADKKEYVDAILNILPSPEHLNEKQFAEIRTSLRNENSTEKPWLICFYMGTATELNLQLKRLPTLISNIHIGLIHCGKNSGLCNALHVSHYPTWGLLKSGGAFELHHGRDVLHEVADFARDGAKSTNLHALSPADYKGIKEEKETWFIDWYAPWCPPCRRLMPILRKVSQHFEPGQVKFGTIDCTMHHVLCAAEHIRAYPTTFLLKAGEQIQYHGSLSENDIVEFISEMMNPSVISLTSENFIDLMRKPVGDIWVVEYFAPWCGPCQRLMPVWRSLAREMKQFEKIKIASVDCVAQHELCNQQNIRSYPMIRLYPSEGKGLNSVAMYTGHHDLLNMKSWIYSFLPSKVIALDAEFIKTKILKKKQLKSPWLIDFYAPWCSHCVDFEPKYRMIADKLDGIARVGKLDCQVERMFCGEIHVNSYPTVRLYFSKKQFYQLDISNPDDIIAETKNLIKHLSLSHDEL